MGIFPFRLNRSRFEAECTAAMNAVSAAPFIAVTAVVTAAGHMSPWLARAVILAGGLSAAPDGPGRPANVDTPPVAISTRRMQWLI